VGVSEDESCVKPLKGYKLQISNYELQVARPVAQMLSSLITTAGRTFRESRLRARDGNPLDEEERPEGQSALSECEARVRRLSEVRVVSGYTARSGAGSETVFRQSVVVWATGRCRLDPGVS
jgi:hypothetical protein